MTKEEIKTLMTNTSLLSTLNTLTIIHEFLDYLLTKEIKIDEVLKRKLNSGEVLENLNKMLEMSIKKMEGDWNNANKTNQTKEE